MAHEMKTTIGDRNVLVQNGAGNDSTTVWLEVEGTDGTTYVALNPDEAISLGRMLAVHGVEAHRRLALANHLLLQG